MSSIYLLTINCFCLLLLWSCNTQKFPSTTVELEDAKVTTEGNILTVETNKMSRSWILTEEGLSTKLLRGKGSRNLISAFGTNDWNLPCIQEGDKAELVSIHSEMNDHDGFLEDMITTEVEFSYPISGIDLKYVIWTLPNAPGVRTQIFLKKRLDSTKDVFEFKEGVTESLVLSQKVSAKAFGYYNDTQHRNQSNTPILKTEVLGPDVQTIDWANGLMVNCGNDGIIVVKESHKCVNQKGVNTGSFLVDGKHLNVSGTGLDKENLSTQYNPCWANWSIVWDGEQENAQWALKEFDRCRFPVGKDGKYIMSNTWGSTLGAIDGRYASRESNILQEIASDKDLGIELLQIDDGWQGQDYKQWKPASTAIYPNESTDASMPQKGEEYSVYPEGWKNVRDSAASAGVDLGLWSAWVIPYQDLVWNAKHGGFKSFKLDFSNLKDYSSLQSFVTKVRNFIIHEKHRVRVNWDVTENAPRLGYYFARDFGNIYLENRKPQKPKNCIYTPWMVLRDIWHVAQYTNINKFQTSIQNPLMVNKKESDAYLYSDAYITAIGLVGSPIFFQETHYYTPSQRDEIRPLLADYKKERDTIYNGYTFSIGDEPNNQNWTGFENIAPSKDSGYIYLFRERLNKEKVHKLKLRYLKDCTIEIENIATGETKLKHIDTMGYIHFDIENAADFRIYKFKKHTV